MDFFFLFPREKQKKTKKKTLSLTGLIAAIIVASPAALARFAMISLPSIRA